MNGQHSRDETPDSQETISLNLSEGEIDQEINLSTRTPNGLSGNDAENLPRSPTPIEEDTHNSSDTVLLADVYGPSFVELQANPDLDATESCILFNEIKEHMKSRKDQLLDASIPLELNSQSTSWCTAMDELKSVSEVLVTDDVNLKPIKPGFTRMFVEVTYLTRLEENDIVRELVNISCEPVGDCTQKGNNRKSDSPGYLADSSDKNSPGSLGSLPAAIGSHFLSRTSYASHASSSSLGSSAGSLHVRKLMKKAAQSAQLSEEKVEELKKHWLNADQLYKILEAIDYVNSGDQEHTIPTQSQSSNGTGDAKSNSQVPTNSPVSSKKSRILKRQAEIGNLEVDAASPKRRNEQSSVFKPGTEVFAKWTDRHYYAAKLVTKQDYKWIVKFYDGGERSLPEDQLIICDIDSLRGQRVYASQTGDDYQKGIVNDVQSNGYTAMYLILTDIGDFSAPSKNLYLTESQGRAIKKSLNPYISASGSSTSSSSGRTTRSRSHYSSENPKPCSSGLQRDYSRKKQVVESITISESEDDYSDSNSTADGPVLSVTGCEREMQSVQSMYKYNEQVKLKNVFGKLPRSDVGIDATILGPIPIGNWFRSLHFLLTCTERITKKPKCDLTQSFSSDCDSATDNEDYEFSRVPFIDDRLRLQLENGSGKVYKNFEDIPATAYHNTYLISDRPNTTVRYQQCLAAGIRIACHDWVIRCCTEKRLIPVQELPAGWSIETNRFVNSFDREYAYPLKGKKIYIAQLNDKNFFKFWSRLCKLAGGNVEKFTAQGPLEGVLCIVVEPCVQDPALDLAQRRNVPLVSTMWLTQTIIHGKIRPFDGHPRYNYLYDDSDD